MAETSYQPKDIEPKWQKWWAEHEAFKAEDNSTRPKKYVLVEFPYPSGEGLHMGHLRSYVAGDVYSRYFRLRGYNVLYPMGWDAFGLPAENYAIKHGVHPSVSVAKNVANVKRQIQALGTSFDWSREVNTTDPEYYRWTQWIFIQFFKAGLAFESTGEINWCPNDKTGLANEEVINGCCERCGAQVEKRHVRQWYLRITEYAQKLLDGLETLTEWPAEVKLQQANWIGKSDGAELDFVVSGREEKVTVFTTRAETLFGVTHVVLAPEHSLVETLLPEVKNADEVRAYIAATASESEQDRVAENRPKTGVKLEGVTVKHPATGEDVPVWIADYVLGNYGTGAVMAVPAHDQRDWEFAQKYGITPKFVIESTADSKDECFDGEGVMMNSKTFDGLSSEQARHEITEKYGRSVVKFKLRDWVFSRQRYWGEPIPLLHTESGIVPVSDNELPVTLPQVEAYEPTGTGESPLAVIDEFVNVTLPSGEVAKRETNTMPQWAGSCWYYLRYLDPHNAHMLASPEKLKYWLPVDVYFGGMEHTTLHLLYSRFWHQFLYDQGLVPTAEPYAKRVPHGIVLASDGTKMSKSKGNVVSPDDLVALHGADTTRMYQLFLGPHEGMVSWNDKGAVGVSRFIERLWAWVHDLDLVETSSDKSEKVIARLAEKVATDIENFRFNTVVSAAMSALNDLKGEMVSRELVHRFLVILSPVIPHVAEELNSVLGFPPLAENAQWPVIDEKWLVDDEVQVVVQVNGKVKAKLTVAANLDRSELEKLALAAVAEYIDGQTPKQVIVVPNKLVNVVI